MTSLQGAIETFRQDALEVVEVAKAMVPTAALHLDKVIQQLDGDIAPFAEKLDAERERLRSERESRRAERRPSS